MTPFVCVTCTHPIIPDELGELGWQPFAVAANPATTRPSSRNAGIP